MTSFASLVRAVPDFPSPGIVFRDLIIMGMRLGEGSAAALAVSLLRAAVACHTGMATFAEAAVDNRP